ncbi:MAG: methionine synthase, partial [Ahrensia sp.]|nr:methionine synthase [Ahrensia sp.]
CCGTSPDHLVAMRRAIDEHSRGERPSLETVVATTGALVNQIAEAKSADEGESRGRRRGRRR